MDWTSLGKQVIALGAPTIGAALGGPVGARVGGVLASILGVEATPQAVGDAVAANPGAVQSAEAAPSADLVAWLSTHATMAASLAASETGRESFFAWGWRPAFSWLTAFLWAWNGVLRPVVVVLTGASLEAIPYDHLVGFSGLWLAIYGGGHTAKAIFGKGAP
jgi:hypothetical protein